MEADFAARVACMTAWTMALMSTFGDDSEGGAGGVWGAGTVGARAVKAGIEEATGEVWSHEGREYFSREVGGNVMSVGGGRLLRSWIWWSVACLFRYP